MSDLETAFAVHRTKHRKPYGKEQLPKPPKGVAGGSFAHWAQVLLHGDLQRIGSAIRNGLIAGKDGATIGRMVVGSMGVNGVDGVTEITRHKIARLGLRAMGRHKRRLTSAK